MRWRPSPAAGFDDVVRVIEDDGRLIIAMASGYQDGFSTCWAAGSRLLLDLFGAAWNEGRDARTAFAAARAAFPARAAGLLTDLDDLGGGPAASLLVAALDEDEVTQTWIGGHRAALVRDGAVVAEAAPQTLRGRFAGQVTAEELGRLPDVLVQAIAADQPDARAGELVAPVRRGDTLVITGGGAAGGDPVVDGAPQAIADAMVAQAFAREPQPGYAVALAVRLGR